MDVLLKDNQSWAHYDTSHFPDVKVTLGKKIRNEEDFQNFLNDWESLYAKNKNFTLHFDTTQVGGVSMKYCFKMRRFIRSIKEKYPKLLEKSFIKTESRWVRFLLSIIFFLEKPVAPVHVYSGSFDEYNNVTTYHP